MAILRSSKCSDIKLINDRQFNQLYRALSFDGNLPLNYVDVLSELWSEHNSTIGKFGSHSLEVGGVGPAESSSMWTRFVMDTRPAHDVCLSSCLAGSDYKSEFSAERLYQQLHSLFALLASGQECTSMSPLVSNAILLSVVHLIHNLETTLLS
jgi:hypothetical protein